MVLGLDRVGKAAARLGSPQKKMEAVQVAGTNGKGTVACLLDGACRKVGLSVGLFTSPHLHRFSERIRVNGEEVDEGVLGPSLDRVLRITKGDDGIPLTFFEVATLAALDVFARQRVGLAVREVGMGGRLDATSICEPSVSGITSIGLDHTALQGETVRQIAHEKAAIARENVTLVVGLIGEEVLTETKRKAVYAGAYACIMG